MLEQLTENLLRWQQDRRSMAGHHGDKDGSDELTLAIQTELITRFGEELFPHGIVMNAPLDFVGDDLRTTEFYYARTRALRMRYNFEMSTNVSHLTKTEIVAVMAQEAYEEFKRELEIQNECAADGVTVVMIPFILLDAVRSIDPTSFEPCLGFKTRYALLKSEYLNNSGRA